jgi:NADH:ubiquinone oxidoreductase subunit 6 (subunit J)
MIWVLHMAADPIFIAVSIITIGSAIVALESRELVYGAIALAISMLGIAGFFLILDSPFVAMFQITVYVGAVAVLVIFMLIFIGGVGALLLLSGINDSTFGNFQGPAINFTTIGEEMLTYYAPALIVLALTLAGAVIGALALARREDIEQQNERTY